MTQDHLIVRVAGHRVAVAASNVLCVIELGNVVPVPGAPPFVLGLATQRSRTLTVFDFAVSVGLPSSQRPLRFAVVLDLGGVGYALAVEAVESVTAAIGPVRPVKANLSAGWARCASGMIETAVGTVLLIDLASLVETEMLEKVA